MSFISDFILTIPEDVLVGARISRDRLEPELRKELALQLYREGIVSGAGSCRLAGMKKTEFQYLLGERGIVQQLRGQDLAKDIENARKWNQH